VLHLLLVGLLLWFALYSVFILPFFSVKRAVSVLLTVLGVCAVVVALALLRRGLLDWAARTYLVTTFVAASLLMVLYGGVRSAPVMLYVALPISAAWLLGERAALVTAAACLASTLLLALLETAGVRVPRYFPGTPMGVWSLMLAAIIVSAAPVVLVLRVLRETLAQSRTLSGRLLRLQDEERRRLAHELHDGIAQTLAALGMNLAALQDDMSETLGAPARRALSESVDLADQCISQIRTFAYLLHPPALDQLGLESALNSYADGFARRSGIQVDVRIPPGLGRLPAQVETAVFRIVQESLANIHRHSGSKVARIRLARRAGELVLEVEDEGRGVRAPAFPSAEPAFAAGVGIEGMKQRARELGGTLEFSPTQPQGVTVRAVFPIPLARAAGGTGV
jgi:signal transduction histidine kinase